MNQRTAKATALEAYLFLSNTKRVHTNINAI